METTKVISLMIAAEPAQVLPELMSKLTQMPPASLEAVHRFVLRLELAQLGEELENDYEGLRKAGELEPDLIDAAIRDHRARHPYAQ
jgi:hypothetical protein